jgi:hypothetical protein
VAPAAFHAAAPGACPVLAEAGHQRSMTGRVLLLGSRQDRRRSSSSSSSYLAGSSSSVGGFISHSSAAACRGVPRTLAPHALEDLSKLSTARWVGGKLRAVGRRAWLAGWNTVEGITGGVVLSVLVRLLLPCPGTDNVQRN